MNIHDAAIRGDVDGVLAELKRGVPVDVQERMSSSTALELVVSQPDASTEIVRCLINAGAKVGPGVLKAALAKGSIGTIAQLLSFGVPIDSVDEIGVHGNYSSLIYAAYGRSDPGEMTLIPVLQFLLENGAKIDWTSRFGESALRIVSNAGRFDAVGFLLDWGANRDVLHWTELMYAVALGTVSEVEALLAQGASLSDRDDWMRTPWLLSLQTGDIAKAQLLLAAGADRSEVGHCDQTPLIYAVVSHHLPTLKWLLAEGFAVDGTDEFGETPLKIAVERGYADMVEVLLAAGADRDKSTRDGERLVTVAANPGVARMLVSESYDLSGLGESAREKLIGVRSGDPRTTLQEFREGRARRFGRSNPDRMAIPFWHAMIQSGDIAYSARMLFGDENYSEGQPVWCYHRNGRSTTLLPDGRIVEVAGEHEDSYDADFCIYNDVVVFNSTNGRGDCEIYGYPESLFPPTDFHSATLVGDNLYLIGSLGYAGTRKPGETPVYRLDCHTFKIVQVLTTGTKPGWISKHRARYEAETNRIHIEGGQCFGANNKMFANSNRYALELDRLRWIRL